MSILDVGPTVTRSGGGGDGPETMMMMMITPWYFDASLLVPLSHPLPSRLPRRVLSVEDDVAIHGVDHNRLPTISWWWSSFVSLLYQDVDGDSGLNHGFGMLMMVVLLPCRYAPWW